MSDGSLVLSTLKCLTHAVFIISFYMAAWKTSDSKTGSMLKLVFHLRVGTSLPFETSSSSLMSLLGEVEVNVGD